MSHPVFRPPVTPSPGMKNTPEVRIRKAEFGDGYTAAMPDGLNTVRASYSLSWDVLFPDEADAIVAFLEAQKGTTPFFYTVPNTSRQVQFTCETWTDQTNAAGYRAITATFRENFNP